MSNRAYARISVGGTLQGQAAIERLAEAIESDAAGTDGDDPFDKDGAIIAIREAAEAKEPLSLSANEVTNGEFEEILAACKELRLELIASWEGCGGAFDAGVRRETPGEPDLHFDADSGGSPMVGLGVIRAARESCSIGNLIANMERCMTASLPPIVVQEDEAAQPERDDDHAIMPDGTRIDRWDERLRTAGARRVPKE